MMTCSLAAILSLALAPQESEDYTRLKIEISTVHADFDPMDLIPITVRWVNGSDRPLRLTLNGNRPYADSLYLLEDPDGRRHRLVQFGPTDCGPGTRIELKPGEYVQATSIWSLSFLRSREGDRIEFGRPKTGAWKVLVSTGVVEAPPHSIVILEDPSVTADVRRLFGSEAWHRFALRSGATEALLTEYRKFLSTDREARQKDLMGLLVGLHGLNDNRPVVAEKMLRIALAARRQNVPRAVLAFPLVYHLQHTGKFDEAIAEWDRVRPEARDFGLKAWTERKERLLNSRR